MRPLQQLLEGILDADFDLNVTYGDVYGFLQRFAQCANMPTEFNGYSWDRSGFWRKYGHIQNAWTKSTLGSGLGHLKLNQRKSDIRYGFVMYLMLQSIENPITQNQVDVWVEDMNQWCEPDKLRIRVKVANLPAKRGFKFEMWNDALQNSTKSYMGYFEIHGNMRESLLDDNFDITDNDISIGQNYDIDHTMYELMVALMDTIFRNANKVFLNKMPPAPEHTIDSAFGTRNIGRYLLDWIASQPIGMLNDDQFIKERPNLAIAFDEWIKNKKFDITLMKMGKTKNVYFNYNKKPILRVTFNK